MLDEIKRDIWVNLPHFRKYVFFWFSVIVAVALTAIALSDMIEGKWQISLIPATFALLFLLNIGLSKFYNYSLDPIIIIALAIIVIPVLVYLLGSAGLYWAYPCVILISFVIPSKRAFFLNLTLLFVLIPAIVHSFSTMESIRALVTLALAIGLVRVFGNVLEKQHQELTSLIVTDPLTGALNRFRLKDDLEALIAQNKRYGTQASIIAFDLDHFKEINDEHGHIFGDYILKQVAEVIRLRHRKLDKLFRYGGEEFIMLLPSTGSKEAEIAANDIRVLLENTRFANKCQVRVSGGLCEVLENDTAETLLARADEALYEAKNLGRNRIQVAV